MKRLSVLPVKLSAHAGRQWIWMLALGVGLGSSTNLMAQDTTAGSVLYNSACAHCHGSNGQGGELGPNLLLRVSQEENDALTSFIRTGNPERGMPPAAVTADQMPDLIAHLRFLVASAGDSALEALSVAATSTRTYRPIDDYVPLSEDKLMHPVPDDWASFGRTLDAQRFSPLDQINTENVDKLGLAWSRGLESGFIYTTPLVYQGVMYLTTPASNVIALDATSGDLLWEYRRDYGNESLGRQGRSKTISIIDDLVFLTAPDSSVVALDARTGELRWEAKVGRRGHTAGSITANGKVISAGHCITGPRVNCVITAHDARTGELAWSFNTVQAPGEFPGGDSWNGVPVDDRLASPWGLPGSYDPETNLVYWGIANPMPTTRAARHGGDSAAAGYEAPTDLYSNSTVAIDADTGELAWYYQHLPGDDWDLDMNQERVLATVSVRPDPEHVRWINPAIDPGETRDVIVNVGEGGGMWVLDRHTGEFLWANPFPFSPDNFFLEDIDVDTGITHIRRDLLVADPGEHHLVCYLNTRSFWPAAYNPQNSSLYVPYIRNCLDMTSADPANDQPEVRQGAAEPGVPEEELNGLAKIDLETGETTHWPSGRIPTNTGIVATAGNLIFQGDIDRYYRALDADSGEILWQTRLGSPLAVGNITYAVDGRQYVAVIAGATLSQQTLSTGFGPVLLDLDDSSGEPAVYVFALPTQAGE